MTKNGTREELEGLYRRYNRPRYRDTDPVGFLYPYPDLADREWVGLLASSLAYGRVAMIRRSVRDVLLRLNGPPAQTIRSASTIRLRRAMTGFRHRWTTGEDVAALLLAMRESTGPNRGLGACLAGQIADTDTSLQPALIRWTDHLRDAGLGRNSLWADPAGSSACKRVHLYLRWMVRRDRIDPGGWDEIPASMLSVPVDTHMLRVGQSLGLTTRRTADIQTVREITAGFARLRPDDPVRYDFALTRPGILEGHTPEPVARSGVSITGSPDSLGPKNDENIGLTPQGGVDGLGDRWVP